MCLNSSNVDLEHSIFTPFVVTHDVLRLAVRWVTAPIPLIGRPALTLFIALASAARVA